MIENIQDVRIFEAIGRSQSLSVAAQRLGLSLTHVSKRLRHLEETMGLRLAQRTTRKLSLTAEGLEFLEACRDVLRAVAIAEDVGSPVDAGVIRLSAAIAFAHRHVAPRVSRFLDRHPALSIQILASNHAVDLVEEGIDLAIRQLPLEDSSLIMRRLVPDAWILCAAPQYCEMHGTPTEPADLTQHHCLTVGDPPPAHWRLNRRDEEVSINLSPRISGSDGEIVHASMLAGGGIAMKSAWDVFDDIRNGRLIRVLPEWWGGRDRWIHIVYPARRYQPRRVRALIDFLADELGQTLIDNRDLDLFDRVPG